MPSEPVWYKSSYSEEGGNNCVEIADLGDRCIGIRHSVRPALNFSIERATFASFVAAIRSGVFRTPHA
ncbi:DUF397 domain-containing protein [Streptomyces sp. NPDC091294]|uniref:DUF397 domain-containing protein n=1 Tax=Streptomyces sp. NPDC091294 TaxID=3365992 RepID=UPI003815FA33